KAACTTAVRVGFASWLPKSACTAAPATRQGDRRSLHDRLMTVVWRQGVISSRKLMKTRYLLSVLPIAALAFAAADGWPHWRGPNDDGMARGEAPLHWSDKEHVAWKATVPGKGHSS